MCILSILKPPPPIFLGCHTVTGWELPLGIYFILGNVLIHGKLSRWLSAGDGFSPWVWKILWRRKWQSAPIFLPENLMDRGALAAQSLGLQKSDMTEHICRNVYDNALLGSGVSSAAFPVLIENVWVRVMFRNEVPCILIKVSWDIASERVNFWWI